MLKKLQHYKGFLLLEGVVSLVVLSILVGLLLPLLFTSKQVEKNQNEQLRSSRYLFELSMELGEKASIKRTYQNDNTFFTVTLTAEKGRVSNQTGEVLMEVVLLNE